MIRRSLLNWVIFTLVVMGVIQLIYIAHQQGDAENKKIEMKQKLDFLLVHLNDQIKDFNSSVSSLVQEKHHHLKEGGLRQGGTTARDNSKDITYPTPLKRTEERSGSGNSLFPPRSHTPFPEPQRAKAPPTLPSELETGAGAVTVTADSGGGERRRKKKRALLFTMDSISSYEANSKRGGAAGEILVRHSLEHALALLGVQLDVMTSDAAFLQAKGEQYDIIIVDPWTWAGKGWVPKPVLRNQLDKVYVLDFFGAERLPKEKPSFRVPASRFLTAFGYPGNQFLGYFMDQAVHAKHSSAGGAGGGKRQQGVIWGKDPKHFSQGRDKLLRQVADAGVELHSTASRPVFRHSRVVWHGHQDRDGWLRLLAQSKFLLGLGDPLLGPSAIDAISMGCVYINPVHASPVRGHFKTQHDYAMDKIGAPYVCNARLSDVSSVQTCIDFALQAELPPFIPPDFQHDAYVARVRSIFALD